MNIAETTSTNPAIATPARRPRWILLFLFAGAARLTAGWLVPTFSHYSLPGSAEDKAQMRGFSDDGSLITTIHRMEHGKVAAWKWSLPDLKKSELWSQTVDSTARDINSDAVFELRERGKFLRVFPPASQPPILIDLATAKAVDEKAREAVQHETRDWELVEDRPSGSEVRDRRSGRSIGRIDEANIDEISPDGRWVAGETGWQIRVWKVGAAGVTMTGISAHRPDSPIRDRISWNSTRLETAEFSYVAFSADSKRFFVYGVNQFDVFETETGNRLHERSDLDVFAFSSEQQSAYALRERQEIVRLRLSDFQETGFNLYLKDWEIQPVAVQPPWLLVAGEPTGSFVSSPPLVDVMVGPFHLLVSNNDGGDLREHFFLVNLDTGRKWALPREVLPLSNVDGGDTYRVAGHSNRFAFQNTETGEIRIVEAPSTSLEFRRTSLAILLFALPGWWCWRGKRPKDQPIYKSSNADAPVAS